MNRHKANRPPLRWFFAVSALSLGLGVEYALAGEPADAPSVTVSYADLDLSRPAGAEVLYSRLQSAARSVCGHGDARDLERLELYRQCYDEVIDVAVKQVSHSGLYAVHYRKFKGHARS